jgi:hypothetical protein
MSRTERDGGNVSDSSTDAQHTYFSGKGKGNIQALLAEIYPVMARMEREYGEGRAVHTPIRKRGAR